MRLASRMESACHSDSQGINIAIPGDVRLVNRKSFNERFELESNSLNRIGVKLREKRINAQLSQPAAFCGRIPSVHSAEMAPVCKS